MLNENMIYLGKERSAIRELFEQGKILKEKYGDDKVYDFSLGNPSIPCPESLNETIKNLTTIAEALDKNENFKNIISTNLNYDYRKLKSTELHGYTSAQGDKIVRYAISDYLNKKYNANTNGDLIYMTAGAAAGLTIVLKAITNDSNDEIIIFTPYFPEYKVFIKNANATSVEVKPNLDDFQPDLDDFKNKITKNTSAIIINSPNNPTGTMYDEETIKKICAILYDKEKEYAHPIYIISDEPYRELVYNNTAYPFITNYYNDSIITYSFSKSLSVPGERIGYILINPLCENKDNLYAAICGAGRSQGYVCAPTLFQFLIPHLLGTTSDISIYKENANLFYNELIKIGYQVVKPVGAFYLFAKALCDDAKVFSKKAIEYNLLLVPSDSFGIDGYIRIAYCVSKTQIINSLPMFKDLYNFYNK